MSIHDSEAQGRAPAALPYTQTHDRIHACITHRGRVVNTHTHTAIHTNNRARDPLRHTRLKARRCTYVDRLDARAPLQQRHDCHVVAVLCRNVQRRRAPTLYTGKRTQPQ